MLKSEISIYKAISDETRLRILKLLEKETLCFCDIHEIIGSANSTVSKHLSILRNSDLITSKKSGKWVYYSLNTNSENSFARTMFEFISSQHNSASAIINDKILLAERKKTPSCNL